jgi:hypothetical protein
MITREQFIAATGRAPIEDDVARVNCAEAGRAGHLCCGWNSEANKPQFEIGPVEWNGSFPRSVSVPGV